MDLLSPDISDTAYRYLQFFECDVSEGVPFCLIKETKELEDYARLVNFMTGTQSNPDIVFVILQHLSDGMPEDDFDRLRWSTREIQQKVSLLFYPENELMAWGINEGEKWVDRSLRVSSDPAFNGKMFDSQGNLRLKNVFVHANHQYIYHCTLDVLAFLNGIAP